jgi:RluA family pseudouridine synthase
MQHAISILYEESHFMLVNKPAGLFTQASPGVDSLEIRLSLQLKERDQHPGEPFIGLPHRLDRGTSGIMLIAKNQRALKRFGEQFHSRKIGKFYLAIVEGQVPHGCQVWEDAVSKIPDQAKAQVVPLGTPGAKLARLSALQVAQVDDLSLLLIKLETGRMHQIRVQAASRGIHVVGDSVYGSERWLGSPATAIPNSVAPPLGLHALRLEYHHPRNALLMSGTADVPQEWHSIPADLVTAAEQLQLQSRKNADAAWSMVQFAG